ncbi:MAG TPA: hypothetical protein VKO87_14675, partial [Gemmatimonadaceae bacterium]|nr:hypothetical protein [Gemmatimonadaceae bacterium]
MYHEEEVELTLEERNALASLPRAIAPSDMLEAHVVRALKENGHFGAAARHRSSVPLMLRIAAAIALFAGGVATGRYALSDETAQRAAVTQPATEVRDVTPA